MQPYTLYLDLGASLTKGFFLSPQGPRPLLIGPEISAPLDRSHLEALKSMNTHIRPELSAWIERSGEIRAIGQFATNFGGESPLQERKEVRAVDKILAAIGVMAEYLHLGRDLKGHEPLLVEVKLGLLVPFSEFETRAAIYKQLRSVNSFQFRGLPLKLLLKDLWFRPEGHGLCLAQMRELESRGIRSDRVKVLSLMFGHRNTSLLVVENTAFQAGKSSSTGPGFIEAEHALSRVGVFQHQDQPKLYSALLGGNPKVVLTGDAAPTDLSQPLKVAHEAYWHRLETWLNANLTPHLGDRTYLVVGGGACEAAYQGGPTIRQRLQGYFDRMGIEASHLTYGLQPSVVGKEQPSPHVQKLSQLLMPFAAEPRELTSLITRCGDVYSSLLEPAPAEKKPAAAIASAPSL
ncbi:MAG: hypothetical protein ACAF41_34285 (plasmid) [Leptolyngbya sp. BL-A-14]